MNSNQMLPVGHTLRGGDLTVIRQLSSGGFGNAYVVRNRLDKVFAMKEFFIRGVNQRVDGNVTVSVADNKSTFESQRAKFEKEARRLSKVDNPHVVKVHDLFYDNGTIYYTMDYIDGESLEDQLKRTGTPLTEEETISLLRQVLDALACVHGQKPALLHLDLKPANIMVDHQGRARLIDFGSSKHIDTYDGDGSVSASTGFTYTQGYAPMEQMIGVKKNIGPWTDFYALGATLYNLTTGRSPKTIDNTLGEAGYFFPTDLSPLMRRLIMKMMNPNRRKRPQTAAEVLDIIDGKVIIDDSELIGDEPTTFEELGTKKENQQADVGQPAQMTADTSLSRTDEQSSQPAKTEGKAPNKRMSPRAWIALAAVPVLFALVYFLSNGLARKEISVSFVCKGLPEATLFIDNVEMGNADGHAISLRQGLHSVRIEHQHFHPLNEEISIGEEEEGKHFTYSLQLDPVFIVGDVSFRMITVEGGTFEMGATPEQKEPNVDEKPVHNVTLDSYYLSETEVTQALWQAVMGTTIVQQRDRANERWSLAGEGPDKPMYYVSWNECQEFIRRLNATTGLKFRMPTEAEWEYAARGGNKSRGCQYSGSNSIDAVACYTVNTNNQGTCDVKTKLPNELGLYDMSGNVREWCQDWYARYDGSTQDNPVGPSSGSFHVGRGGSWGGSAWDCRVSIRGVYAADKRFDNLGFRLAI